jgi:HK97 family phage major capsid protein
MPVPNEAMKEEAQRGLDWRSEFGRGGTEVGIARARDIVNGANLSDDTIGRMVSYFARHEVDKEAEGFRVGEEGYPSNGRIAWALWGGDAGKTWSEREYEKIKSDRSLDDARPYPNEHAARLKDPEQYDSFARKNNEGGEGIDFIYGIKDGVSELQAIRFDKTRFTTQEAKAWLKSHDFEPILFEEASERKIMSDEERAMVSVSIHVDTEDVAEIIEAQTEQMATAAQIDLESSAENALVEQPMEMSVDVAEDRKSGERVTRADAMEARVESVDDRRVSMSISSEMPVGRSYGEEVLDHNPQSIDLSFLNSGRAPLLMDHDPERQIGVIESVSLDGSARKLRATVRFGKSALASEVYGDVADLIRGNVSIGYSIAKMVKENDGRTYRATNWRPVEVSIVSIPADVSVGVGRSMETETTSEAVVETSQITETLVEAQTQVAETETPKERKMENSATVATESRAYDAPIQAEVGLTQKEVRQFSFVRAINALANPQDKRAWANAAFEREVSDAAQKTYGRSAQGIFVPNEVVHAKRDLTVGTASAGGNLVATDLLAASFIEMLRNRSVVQRAGATVLNGLVGNVAIPKQSGAATAYWVAESGAPTESQQTLAQVTMSPKTVGAYTDFSRKLMIQSSIDVESMVRRDLATVIALAIDAAALYGTGSNNQPTGIKLVSGINTKDFAATNPTFAELVGMESEVATDNADIGTMTYLFNPAQRGALKTTEKSSTSAGQFVWEAGNTVNGYRTEVSNQVTAGDVFFGNFADLLIGFFSGLDLMVDPYSNSTSGTMRVVALQDTDIAVRNAVSFCYGDADIA